MIQRITGTLTTLAPLHHGGDENAGNIRLLRSIKTMQPNGRSIRLPLISGNTIRGNLRRKLMRDMLQRIGYTIASPKLHHALYTGGVLESSSDAAAVIDLAFRRSLEDALPPLDLLGAAIGNQMITSALSVNHAFPICIESEARLPPPLRLSTTPKRSITDFTFTTRRDDLRDESINTTQMIVEFEVFAVGVEFAHSFVLRHASDVTASALGHAIELWQEDPYVGGKIASGHGELDISYPDAPSGELYRSWLDDNRMMVVKTLDDLTVRLGQRKAEQSSLDLAS